jgi:hypothetical protein
MVIEKTLHNYFPKEGFYITLIDVDVSFKFDDKLYVCISKSSNKLVLKFGRPQLQQYQLASDCSSGS